MTERMPSPPSSPSSPPESSHGSMSDFDKRSNSTWFVSFAAAMVPFSAFCYGHHKGVTVRVLEKLAKTKGGVYAIFALPFLTLGMEKCVYDTVQSIQGINPNTKPADRGGFPSGGASLPSFSLVNVQETNIVEDFISRQFYQQKQLVRKMTQKASQEEINR